MVANRLRDAAAVLEVDSAYRRDAAIMREAADEVDRLRHDIERHVEIACELATECERLRAELETERMRLVACSVIALANTPESAASARDMHPDYQSPYCDDVARAIDREIALRAELAELRRFRKVIMDYDSNLYDAFFVVASKVRAVAETEVGT